MLPSDLLEIVCQYLDDIDVLHLSYVCEEMRVVLSRPYFRRQRIQVNPKYPKFIIDWLVQLDQWLTTHIALTSFDFPKYDNYALPTGHIVLHEKKKVYDISAKEVIYITNDNLVRDDIYVVYINKLDQLMLRQYSSHCSSVIQLTSSLVAHYIHIFPGFPGDRCGVFVAKDGTVSMLESFSSFGSLINYDTIVEDGLSEPETIPDTYFFVCPPCSSHELFCRLYSCRYDTDYICRLYIDNFHVTFECDDVLLFTGLRGGKSYYQALMQRVQQYLDKC